MDIISAYREVGSYRGAARIAGTTPKTVRRVIARHEGGGGAPERVPRVHNYDGVATLVAGRVKSGGGGGGGGGGRGTSGGWSRRRSRRGAGIITAGGAPRCGRRVSTW